MNLPPIKKEHVLAAGIGLSFGLGSGMLLGYFYAEKKLRAELYEKVDQELSEMREYYSKKYKVGEYETPAGAVEALKVDMDEVNRISRERGYLPTDDIEPKRTPEERAEKIIDLVDKGVAEANEKAAEGKVEVVKNVFVEPPADRTTRELDYEGWDYENERARRSGKEIFIITQEEFFTNEPEHEQATLTWFEGDGVLVDEADMPIEDITQVIGSEHLLKFGHGTKDANTVHIRNLKLQHDVEIVRSHGKFAEEVAGFLKHSDDGHRKPRRKNWDDE